jgi:hypothetical protein
MWAATRERRCCRRADRKDAGTWGSSRQRARFAEVDEDAALVELLDARLEDACHTVAACFARALEQDAVPTSAARRRASMCR